MDPIVTQLYVAFAGDRPTGRIEGCPCCVSPEDEARLGQTPLRALPVVHVARYAARALNTWGDERDFRGMLPRILELAIGDEGGRWHGLEPFMIADKIERAGWAGWTTAQQGAVTAAITVWWRDLLERGSLAELALPDFARLIGAAPLLEQWAALPGPGPTLALAELARSRPSRRGWSPDVAAAVDAWLAAPEQRSRLEDAFEAAPDGPDSDILASAIDAIELVATSAPPRW